MTTDKLLKRATARPWKDIPDRLKVVDKRLAVLAVNSFEPMRELLFKKQWGNAQTGCPCCFSLEHEGHTVDCPLFAALQLAGLTA